MKTVRVLVVDDSFTMRLLITDLLNSDPNIIVVAAVKSGEEALQKLSILKPKPNCITLDLMLPGMDGLSTLKKIMAKYPTPTIILSAYSKQDADITFKCLANGATSFVAKPSGELSYNISDIKKELIEKVKAVSQIQPDHILSLLSYKGLTEKKWHLMKSHKMVVIGSSTGGPQTLEAIFSSFPADCPVPILIAQHIPKGQFLNSFVTRLNKNCWMNFKIAEDKEYVRAGTAYCAPNGFELKLEEFERQIRFRLFHDNSTSESPSINNIMRSASEVYADQTIGIILSGMGEDGVEGMRQIKLKGGSTLVQDETALLFGMPKAVIDKGLADQIASLESIPSLLKELLQR